MSTKIEYTDRTWNVVHGYSKISVGCWHCYAEKMANRLRGRSGYPEYKPFQPIVRHDRLKEPFKWKKPQRVMVTSMGDLFHDEIPGTFITQVYEIMLANPQHTFLNLTKRSVEDQYNAKRIVSLGETQVKHKFVSFEPLIGEIDLWQPKCLIDNIRWAIIGCESGPSRRYTNIDWVRKLWDQCVETGISVFIKQLDFGNGIIKMPELDGKVWDKIP